MNFAIEEAARLIGGKVTGNEQLQISRLSKIEDAQPGDLTFLYLPSYEKHFSSTKASAILVKPGFNKTRDNITYIEVKDPNKAFSNLLIHFFTPGFNLSGIDPKASIDTSVKLGKNVAVGKNVVISEGCSIGDNTKIFHNTVISNNCKIGSNCLIFQNVSIREESILGDNVIIHPNTVIGSDGFGFYTDEKGRYIKIPQIGNVVIEDDVELGSNVSVDRAAIGSTVIKRGVKIDNLVQVAHNVVIGEDTVVSSQSGISGSTKIGKHCILAGQTGLVGHIEISDNIIILAQAGVSKSLTKPGKYFGSPAKEFNSALKLEVHQRNLPEYAARIKILEDEVARLKEEMKIKTGQP
jgi:UDP-3-O-[3-hydroxymyristoyl] glucosamine N-acyltransferase